MVHGESGDGTEGEKLSGKRTCIRTETLERSAYAGTEGVMLSGKKERADS